MPGFVALLGYIGATFTTLSLIPEIYKTYRKKEARDLSYIWLGALGVGQLFWFAYALFIDSLPLMAAAVVSIVLVVIQALMAIRYERRK